MFRLFHRRAPRRQKIDSTHLTESMRRDLNLPPRGTGDRWSPPGWWMR